MKKIAVILAVVALVAAYFAFDLGQYLTLDSIRRIAGDVSAVKAREPVLVAAAFFALYVAATAASLPGAAILTVAAGALFGLVTGTILVSFASTIGATLAFLASRYVLRDWVEGRFGSRLDAINAGLERDGPFYLFTIRMIPLVPFFVVNLVMGLTRIRTWTFAWVSQIGMVLATAVFVNAGTQLAQIEDTSDLLSPILIGSFALLGLVPWIAKAVVAQIRRRRVYASFDRPKRFDRNLIVIGAGSAGLVSAYIAAQVKASVTLIEADKMGGDCLNTGCVPSKTLIKSAKVAAAMRKADRYGLTPVEPDVPFDRVIERIHGAIRTIEPHDSVERYERLGVDVVLGYATLTDPWTVEVARKDGATQRLTARNIVIASGAKPRVPEIEGLEGSGYLTSDTMWDAFATMDRAPEKVVVLGGGPIGCELSQALSRLGSNVTQVERGDSVLGREDTEISEMARTVMEDAGVIVLTGHEAVRVEPDALVAKSDEGERTIPFDILIVAVGRAARLERYGLERLGIDTKGTIVHDEFLATKYPNIFVAGDVAGPFQYTHAASHQAWFASVNALFGQFKRFKADYRVLPAVTFLDPEFARVGLNEREAREQGKDYKVTTYCMEESDRAIAESETQGFIKVLTVPGKDTILGATIVAANAGELIAEFTLAMKHKIGLNGLLGTVHAYPTLAEANKFAAGNWKRANKPERLLKIAERYFAWRRG